MNKALCTLLSASLNKLHNSLDLYLIAVSGEGPAAEGDVVDGGNGQTNGGAAGGDAVGPVKAS